MALFSELLEKMARQERLTPLELEQLRQEARALDDVRRVAASWMRPSTNNPTFQQLTVTNQPNFNQSPLHVYLFRRATNATITHNTSTYITFDGTAATTYGESQIFKLDESDLTKLLTNPSGQNFQISGFVNWAQNATGYRLFGVEFFDINGVSGGTMPFHVFAGHNLEDNYFPVSYADSFKGFGSPLGYMKFYVKQTSGGDLTLKDVVLGIYIV